MSHSCQQQMNQPAPFPRKGQIWEVVDGCDVHIQCLFRAPITMSGSGRLADGERVCVTTEATDTLPVEVSFVPVRYEELHDSLVSADIRNTHRYHSYLLSVTAEYFREHFRLVEGAT